MYGEVSIVERHGITRVRSGVGSIEILHPSNLYTPQYQAVLDRGTALGYTLPSIAQRIKQDQLVRDLIAAGIWDELDVLQVYATDGDNNFALLNWKDPATIQAARISTVTFTVNVGYNIPDIAGGKALNTNWIPSNGVKFSLNDCSYGFYIASNGTSVSGAFGCEDSFGGNAVKMNFRTTVNTASHFINESAGVTQGAVVNAIGFYHKLRLTSGGNQCRLYKDAALVSSQSGPSTARPGFAFYMGATNRTGAVTGSRVERFSCFWAGSRLDTKVAAWSSAWSTYFTSL